MQQLYPEPGPVDQDTLIDLYAPPPDPSLRVNFVSSLDGAGTLRGRSAGLSGPEDKRVFGILRMRCDALLVGAGTVREEGYRALRLDEQRRRWRLAHGMSEFPTLVVVSGRADLDPAQPALADAPVRPVVVTTRQADAGPLHDVADVVRAGDGHVDLAAAVAALRERGHAHILSEGGPTLFGSLTVAGLVDELCLTLSPLLTGPGAGRITAGPEHDVPEHLTLRHALLADGQLLLRYAR
ncbi:pyrimidine reductase family protein [Dactylosporangium aurantiacum]|uniref:Pyrimidine reductase family protein n=1 Tax=Dactylosporangium aurantiacum TaxID=35754 RepID=A0A9Q9INN9_9ACTN|nr:pyrimidine reductase family protein [Dactylosporangium aurantiacum]UWZ56278.1 pyrimidine reductase family protein [Dactylosporangium aurantiacum]